MSIASSLSALAAAKNDIAEAITAKGGTVGTGAGFTSFADAIATIPSGGGDEPEPPQDGKTRIYLNVPAGYMQDLKLAFQQTVSNGVLVDLGDGREPFTLAGSTEDVGTASINFSYQTPGKYVITFEVLSGELILQNFDLTFYEHTNIIYHSSMDPYSGLNNGLVYRVIIGEGVSTIGELAFVRCDYLNTCIICDGVTSIEFGAFQFCYSLQSITIPESVTSIGTQAFYKCYSLQSITIPESVTSIEDSAFYNCTSMKEYIFLPTIPPVLGSTNVFGSIPSDCKIFVPDESVSAYKAAANWATYADKIYPISERV